MVEIAVFFTKMEKILKTPYSILKIYTIIFNFKSHYLMVTPPFDHSDVIMMSSPRDIYTWEEFDFGHYVIPIGTDY